MPWDLWGFQTCNKRRILVLLYVFLSLVWMQAVHAYSHTHTFIANKSHLHYSDLESNEYNNNNRNTWNIEKNAVWLGKNIFIFNGRCIHRAQPMQYPSASVCVCVVVVVLVTCNSSYIWYEPLKSLSNIHFITSFVKCQSIRWWNAQKD